MEMKAAAREAEPPQMAGGVWLWLPDRGVCVQPYYAAKYCEKNPLPDGMHDSPRQGIKRDRVVFRGDAFRGDGTQADVVSRSLSESDIRKRSSSSHTPSSATHKVPTPDTPSAGHFKRNKAAKTATGLRFDACCDHDPATGKCYCAIAAPRERCVC